ncbi:choline-phosphate cytidylyltransferase [Nematocida sp. AWRm80]|nr:choline-phosphate cytidylyltransferase [Nematocida sp. AWRm80]
MNRLTLIRIISGAIGYSRCREMPWEGSKENISKEDILPINVLDTNNNEYSEIDTLKQSEYYHKHIRNQVDQTDPQVKGSMKSKKGKKKANSTQKAHARTDSKDKQDNSKDMDKSKRDNPLMEKKKSNETDQITTKGIRVYSDGVFDLFHYGHMRMLEQIRHKFPNATIVAGVCSDRETHKYKGETVMTMKERAESLRHCKWVDEIIENAPWIITKRFIKKHNIDYVAHDSIPYVTTDTDDAYKTVKEMGIFVPTLRADGISTSELITRIIRSYDKYLKRNILRGVSNQELNISRFTEKKIKIQDTVEKNIDLMKDRIKEMQKTWKDITDKATQKFIQIFDSSRTLKQPEYSRKSITRTEKRQNTSRSSSKGKDK